MYVLYECNVCVCVSPLLTRSNYYYMLVNFRFCGPETLVIGLFSRALQSYLSTPQVDNMMFLLFMCRRSGVGLPPFPSLHHQELPQQRDVRREPAERAAGAQLPREVKRSVQI